MVLTVFAGIAEFERCIPKNSHLLGQRTGLLTYGSLLASLIRLSQTIESGIVRKQIQEDECRLVQGRFLFLLSQGDQKIMPTLKLHYDGWISLPTSLRTRLALRSGDHLEADLVDGAIVLRRLVRTRSLDETTPPAAPAELSPTMPVDNIAPPSAGQGARESVLCPTMRQLL